MTVVRRVVVAGGVAAGLAGAYFAGAMTNRPQQPTSTTPAPAADAVAEVNGLKIPNVLPPATPDAAADRVQQPTGVLTGEVKVPADVLRAPPPKDPPAFVIPDVPK
jgi:hypothetical protein